MVGRAIKCTFTFTVCLSYCILQILDVVDVINFVTFIIVVFVIIVVFIVNILGVGGYVVGKTIVLGLGKTK